MKNRLFSLNTIQKNKKLIEITLNTLTKSFENSITLKFL